MSKILNFDIFDHTPATGSKTNTKSFKILREIFVPLQIWINFKTNHYKIHGLPSTLLDS